MMHRIRNKGVALGSATFFIVALYLIGAAQLPRSALDGAISSAGFPTMLGWGLLGASALLIVQSLSGTRGAVVAEAVAEPGIWATPGQTVRKASGLLVILFGYVLLLPWLGYALSIFLLVVLVVLYQKVALSWRVLLVGGIGALVLYLLFVAFLRVRMPSGIWQNLF